MTENPINRFVAAAAEVYHATGNAEAVKIASWLREHAGRRYAIEAGNPPAAGHLDTILAARDLHAAARGLGPAIKTLDWTEGALPMPASLRSRYCFVTLIGEGTAVPDDRLFFGLYIQAPGTYYPAHWHHAEELYYVLSGTASWQQGDQVPRPKPPGTLIHHLPDEPHIMETHGEPLLAMWTWFGDLDPDSYTFGE